MRVSRIGRTTRVARMIGVRTRAKKKTSLVAMIFRAGAKLFCVIRI